ncbi:MAG: oxygen-dependent coproporphyrinogen oxidase [Cytophagales bacterium]|nr:MAG: oxygen-dependent coproporphyrinogen oxidase [Cytophagales bacterium]
MQILDKETSKNTIKHWFMHLQDHICRDLVLADGGNSTFKEDIWTRTEGGGGRTRTLTNGKIIEKGGVAFSAVWGKTPEKILSALKLENADFFATGVSIVLHPHNPNVPIIHMNVRYFEMSNGIWWFGGGIDLTPHYVVENDARFFHSQLKNACDKHDSDYYPKFKNWADDYFFIKHRNETRGIGGIFFDQLNNQPKENIFDFVKEIGNTFIPIYTHLMKINHEKPSAENEKKWQAIRRGRYVEFNLVYDKGTKFGLDTNGRTESILMSMPPMANWDYQFPIIENSLEFKTQSYLKKGIEWI